LTFKRSKVSRQSLGVLLLGRWLPGSAGLQETTIPRKTAFELFLPNSRTVVSDGLGTFNADARAFARFIVSPVLRDSFNFFGHGCGTTTRNIIHGAPQAVPTFCVAE
jgi:hypothetical protein